MTRSLNLFGEQACFRAVIRVGRRRRSATSVPDEWSSPLFRKSVQNPAYRPSGIIFRHFSPQLAIDLPASPRHPDATLNPPKRGEIPWEKPPS